MNPWSMFAAQYGRIGHVNWVEQLVFDGSHIFRQAIDLDQSNTLKQQHIHQKIKESTRKHTPVRNSIQP